MFIRSVLHWCCCWHSPYKPQLREVSQLLKEKSPSWSDIGAEFDVPFHVRESLRHDTSNFSRVEKVLNEWLSSADQTREEFVRVLTSLNYTDIVDRTNEFLR